MPQPHRPAPHDTHTVVLQPRSVLASRLTKNGLKQGRSTHARGSPQLKSPGMGTARTGPLRYESVPGPQINTYSTQREIDLLVRFGIDSVLGRVVTRVLLLLLLLQPVYVAYAVELEEENIPVDETLVEEGETVEEDLPEQLEEENTTLEEDTILSVRDDELFSDEGIVVDDTDETSSDTNVLAEENESSINATFDQEVATEDTSDTDGVDGTTTGEDTQALDEDADTATTTATTTVDLIPDDEQENVTDSDGAGSGGSAGTNESDEEVNTSGGSSEEGGEEDSNNDNATSSTATTTLAVDEGDDVTASSSDETASTSDELVTPETTNASNMYSFGEGDCTLVADGEFYCVANGIERQSGGDPRVYAEKDREGDREIYYFDGADVVRITNNGYDDFAPVFDDENLRIVWQAMINDRLQIMVHDLTTKSTRQITTNRNNSSNPHILDDTVVWQEWVDTNWEIFMTDVDNNGDEFDIERLTDNMVHDMFPQIYDGLVTWQREKGHSWEVIVYDLRSGTEHALQKDEDTKYENPRFVLLFDSRHENGDVETVGYDLESGEMMELGTRARPIPVDPQTPNDETPKAIARTGTSTPELKEVPEADGGDGAV